MRILFICGSLEPGKDGVGDYSRRLAIELFKYGHEAQIISINDKHIQVVCEGLQSEEKLNINVLRLPASDSWNERLHITKSRITSFDPDWISLQFVSFAFQRKGLPFKIANQLKKLKGNAKWHIMFHELWIGVDEQASFKNKWLGRIQRVLIKKMISTLTPDVIHTQTTLYQHMLEGIGVTATLLPLFSNVPVTCYKRRNNNEGGVISFVMFGGIHYGAPVKKFLTEVALYVQQINCKAIITFIGRNGPELLTWLKECDLAEVASNSAGEKSSQEISSLLASADFGIATTPYLLLEKSGSVAAMLEHKLPVICVARNWRPRDNFDANSLLDVYEYNVGNLNTTLTSCKPVLNPVTLSAVAKKFINDIL